MNRPSFYKDILRLLPLLVLGACHNRDEENVRAIDQIVNVYIDSAGTDMFNTKLKAAYSGFSINDVYGLTDTAPVTAFTMKKTSDTINYMEYVAGARRILVDSSNADSKVYESLLAFHFTKTAGTATHNVYDTLRLRYTKTPSLFQITTAQYKTGSKTLSFSKTAGTSNDFHIEKQ